MKTENLVKLRIVVHDAETSEGIKDAKFETYLRRSRSAVSSVTDEKGESYVDIVENGLYVIRAAADGMMHRAQRYRLH